MSTPLAYMLNWKINDKSRGKLLMWFQWFRGYRLWPNNPVITNFASLSSKLWPTYILTRWLILTIKTAPPHMIAPIQQYPHILGGVVTIGNLFVKFTKLLEGDKFYRLSLFGTDKNILWTLLGVKMCFYPFQESAECWSEDTQWSRRLAGCQGRPAPAAIRAWMVTRRITQWSFLQLQGIGSNRAKVSFWLVVWFG